MKLSLELQQTPVETPCKHCGKEIRQATKEELRETRLSLRKGKIMKRTLIIECDSELSTVFLYEATEPKIQDGQWVVERGEKIVNQYPNPKFYGVLDSLLITSERLANAKPITPVSV